jgi:hypothetical protein
VLQALQRVLFIGFRRISKPARLTLALLSKALGASVIGAKNVNLSAYKSFVEMKNISALIGYELIVLINQS